MFEVIREVHAPVERVWAVLEDGWSYASWVVGASRMRAVEDRWPAVGSKLHHSAGVWPLVLNDETEVKVSEPNRRLTLVARGRPFGEAVIDILLEPQGDGCLVRIREDAISGPGKAVPEPVRQLVLGGRNKETLRRLGYIAEHRTSPESGDGPTAGSKDSLQQSKIKPN